METEDINKQIEDASQLLKKSECLLEDLGILKGVEDKEEIIFNKVVRKFGQGAGHLIVPSKFIDHQSIIIIKKKQENENKDENK